MTHQHRNLGQLTRRQLLKQSGALALTTLLAACAPATLSQRTASPSAQEQSPALPSTAAPAVIAGTTTVVFMTNRDDFPEEQEKQFEAANPHIQIEYLPFDVIQLNALHAAGKGPDLLRAEAPAIPQYLVRNMLLDLSPYFATSKMLRPTDLLPANDYYKANSPFEIGKGKAYGMCKDWSPDLTLFANKQAFEEAGIDLPSTSAPLSYAALFQIAKKLTQFKEGKLQRWGYSYPEEWIDRIWMNMLAEQGESLYTEDLTKLNLLGSTTSYTIAKHFFGLAKENIVYNAAHPMQVDWPGLDFIAGKIGLIQYGYWFSAMADSESTQGQVVMLPAPTWSGQRRDPTVSATGTVILASTKVPDVAWQVFEWYHGGQPAVERAKSGWGVPALKSLVDLIPNQTAFQQQAQEILREERMHAGTILQFNPFLEADAFPASWSKNLKLALANNITFDKMLEQIEQEVNTTIQATIARMA